jgi:hypothetical protein
MVITLATLLPLVLPMVPSIIQGVENIFGAKKGREKKEASVEMVSVLVKKLRESGTLTDNTNAQDVATLIEATLQSMKASGQLQEDGKTGAGSRQVVIRGTIETP